MHNEKAIAAIDRWLQDKKVMLWSTFDVTDEKRRQAAARWFWSEVRDFMESSPALSRYLTIKRASLVAVRACRPGEELMEPPTCKTCGKRTDLSDMHGYSRCWACRRRLYPGVYVEAGDERVRNEPVVDVQERVCQHTTLVARTDETYECKWCGEVFTLIIGGPVTGAELRQMIEERNAD